MRDPAVQTNFQEGHSASTSEGKQNNKKRKDEPREILGAATIWFRFRGCVFIFGVELVIFRVAGGLKILIQATLLVTGNIAAVVPKTASQGSMKIQ